MSQSLHQVHGHIVFSTKDRAPLITGETESALFAYLGGIVRDLGGSPISINGMPDHVHVLLRASKRVADADFMRQLKGSSSRWMGEQGVNGFRWQTGYGWFGVGAADVKRTRAYIEGQKDRHRAESFQEEYRRFLDRAGVEYDERYVWD